MQPDYEIVMEFGSFVWTMVPLLLHGLTLAAQVFLGAVLALAGLAAVLTPGRALPGLGTLSDAHTRGAGALQLAAGALVLAPLALGWTTLASFVGTATAIALLWRSGRGVLRGLAFAAAALTLAFLAFERDDPATLAARILFKAQEWRAHELEWQLANDVRSPKVGDLAPDFELHDPSGTHSVRLSDFFGRRPVALVFGSYT